MIVTKTSIRIREKLLVHHVERDFEARLRMADRSEIENKDILVCHSISTCGKYVERES